MNDSMLTPLIIITITHLDMFTLPLTIKAFFSIENFVHKLDGLHFFDKLLTYANITVSFRSLFTAFFVLHSLKALSSFSYRLRDFSGNNVPFASSDSSNSSSGISIFRFPTAKLKTGLFIQITNSTRCRQMFSWQFLLNSFNIGLHPALGKCRNFYERFTIQ